MSYTAVALRHEEHRGDLARLWTENMGASHIGSVVDARLRWFYDENPYGAPTTFLAVQSPGDGVVGCASCYPRDTFVGGRRIKAGILAEFAVHKNHRVAGAAVALQRAVAAESAARGTELLYGYPNKNGVQIFQRVGHKVIGEVCRWAKPLRTAYKIREIIPNRLLAEAAAAAVDVVFAAEDARTFARDPLTYTTETVRTADGRFDELWRRSLPAPYIMGERSAAYLNWRYAGFKTAEYKFFCLIERATRRLAGYVAYTIAERKVTIADLFSDDLARTAAPLLLRFALQMRLAGMSFISLSYIGNASFERQLEALRFMRASGTRPLVVYAKGAPDDLKNEMMDKERWFMIDGELDI